LQCNFSYQGLGPFPKGTALAAVGSLPEALESVEPAAQIVQFEGGHVTEFFAKALPEAVSVG
jgi:hypothetical protein